MKMTLVKPAHIIRKWDIDGYPTYFFGADKNLYRIDARGCYSINRRQEDDILGYMLKSRFIPPSNFAHRSTTYAYRSALGTSQQRRG